MINKTIKLNNLELKTFTEQDVLDYCQLNNLNPDNIYELTIDYNKLSNISGVKLFKNLKILNIGYNLLENINIVKNLINLKTLTVMNNKIKDISVLKDLTNLDFFGYIK